MDESSPPPGERAFTLIEILTVVMILAITSAIIIPNLGTRDDLKASAGARVIMADLIWAQNRAISTQQKQYVIFSGQSYTLWYKNSSGTLVQNTNPVTKNTYTTTFGTAGTPLATVSISGTPAWAFASSCISQQKARSLSVSPTGLNAACRRGSKPFRSPLCAKTQ